VMECLPGITQLQCTFHSDLVNQGNQHQKIALCKKKKWRLKPTIHNHRTSQDIIAASYHRPYVKTCLPTLWCKHLGGIYQDSTHFVSAVVQCKSDGMGPCKEKEDQEEGTVSSL
jgi:hypothetical protein